MVDLTQIPANAIYSPKRICKIHQDDRRFAVWRTGIARIHSRVPGWKRNNERNFLRHILSQRLLLARCLQAFKCGIVTRWIVSLSAFVFFMMTFAIIGTVLRWRKIKLISRCQAGAIDIFPNPAVIIVLSDRDKDSSSRVALLILANTVPLEQIWM